MAFAIAWAYSSSFFEYFVAFTMPKSPIQHVSCQLSLIAYNLAMRTTSYSDLRKTLAATLDSVTNDHEPVIITRDRGKPAAVLISLEDFASYEETLHLLKSPKNADRLLKAIAELDAGKGTERKLIDPAE